MKHQKKQMLDTSIGGDELMIPDELRQALAMAVNGSLDTEGHSPSVRRKTGYDNLRAAHAGVGYAGPQPRPSAEEEVQWIADVLYAEKLEERAKRNRG